MSIFAVDATWIVSGGTPPVTPPAATGAEAGAPGFFTPSGATGPANFAALSGITASPSSAWTTGQYVRLGDDSMAHWNGSAWAVGPAGSTGGTGKLPIDYATPGWAAEWMAGRDSISEWTTARAQSLAARFDVLAAHGNHLQQWIPTLRSVNPQEQVILYHLGPYSTMTEAGTTAASSWPEEWFAHSSLPMVPPDWAAVAAELNQTPRPALIDVFRRHKGNRILTEEPFKTWLMDVGNAGWRAHAARDAVDSANRVGYHGVFLDSLGFPNVGYVDAAAINPRTGTAYRDVDWLAAADQQIQDVRALAPNAFIGVNGIGNSALYYRVTKVLGQHADLAMAERWLRDPKVAITAFPTATTLKASIDMIVDLEATTSSGLATVTKLWTNPDATVAEQNRWYQYAQAAFMCGTGGKSRLFFVKDGDAPAASGGAGASSLWEQPSPVLTIGTPSGAYTQIQGAFRRLFTNGVAIVNGPAAAVAVTLPAGTYTRSDTGATVTGSITVQPSTGVVLTKV